MTSGFNLALPAKWNTSSGGETEEPIHVWFFLRRKVSFVWLYPTQINPLEPALLIKVRDMRAIYKGLTTI
jgi:hypothetical protein